MPKVSKERFNQMVAEQITVANTHLPESDPGVAGAALMQAAARFNAFVSASRFVSGRMMLQSKDLHINHYVALYRRYLEDNYQEYADNYDKYQGPKKTGISK